MKIRSVPGYSGRKMLEKLARTALCPASIDSDADDATWPEYLHSGAELYQRCSGRKFDVNSTTDPTTGALAPGWRTGPSRLSDGDPLHQEPLRYAGNPGSGRVGRVFDVDLAELQIGSRVGDDQAPAHDLRRNNR
jgi:hypothetical protein